jgi:hypothetical protein
VIDTLLVLASPQHVAATPPGRKKYAGKSSGSVIQGQAALDSAQIAIEGGSGTPSWSATTTAPWVTLTTSGGGNAQWLRWSRGAAGLAAGVHVATITVAAGAASAQVSDTLVVVEVPASDAAGEDLFTGVRLLDAQRALLDQEGNRNGRYDTGDFLALMERIARGP